MRDCGAVLAGERWRYDQVGYYECLTCFCGLIFRWAHHLMPKLLLEFINDLFWYPLQPKLFELREFLERH